MIDAIKMSLPSIGGFSGIGGIDGATAAAPAGAATGTGLSDFATHLAETLRSGEQAAVKGVMGEMPLHQTVETVLEAERSLTAALAIRDKIVSAFLEISRMQI